MALIKCPQCGGQVSTDAVACPHCGAPRSPRSKGVSPWTIIGWLFLGFVVLLMYGCYQAFKPGSRLANLAEQNSSTAAPPDYSVRVVGMECEVRDSGTVAHLTITNSGTETIPFAKAFFRFDANVVDTYFSPSSIPPGALASADGYARARVSCGGYTIQAQNGSPVRVEK